MFLARFCWFLVTDQFCFLQNQMDYGFMEMVVKKRSRFEKKPPKRTGSDEDISIPRSS